MLASQFRNGSLAVAILSTLAFAQQPPAPQPPTPPPATPPAPAANPPAAPANPPAAAQGASRHKSELKLGGATISLEHGQPPWTEERLGQMAQAVPVGTWWRMGSEGLTTIDVKGAPIFFGQELIEPGHYGFNLLHVGENAWSFLVFEPKHEAEAATQMMDEVPQQVATKFVGDATPATPALTIDLSGAAEAGKCELAWGPMRVSAPVTAIAVTHSDISLNGNAAETSWFRWPLPTDADLKKPTIAGRVKLELDDENCSMNVYLMLDGDNVVALFRNQERERWETENAQMDLAAQQFDQIIARYGQQAEAQLGPRIQALHRKKAKNEINLEDSVNRPDNLKFSAAPADGTPGTISCDMVKTRGRLFLEVTFGGKKAVIRVDEESFAMKASG